MEIYIIAYTFIWLMMIFLFSLPLKILGGTVRGMKKVINLKKIWWRKTF